jgi:hypothetical protein
LVDTAIFTVKKERAIDRPEMVYIDIRKPNAESFNISDEEWKQIRTSKENLSGWERILDRTFSALGHDTPNWQNSHTCDGDKVYKDENSTLLKFKVSFEPYRKAINFSIFSPTEYNSQILENVIKPARNVFDSWWEFIEDSSLIEKHRSKIERYRKNLKPNEFSLIGLLVDGGVGLGTANNGKFVGVRASSELANRIKQTRPIKLFQALSENPAIKKAFPLFKEFDSLEQCEKLLNNMRENEIRELFDGIKDKFGLRIFSKGYLYRIVSEKETSSVENLTDKEKLNGIKSSKSFVPYEKGDKGGNRWYSETPYLIDWSFENVTKHIAKAAQAQAQTKALSKSLQSQRRQNCF